MTLTGPTATRATPGIVFETAPQPLDPSLPRLDIAGFVGFAPSGPIDTPVVVEDAVRYREIFGPDQTLGFDPDSGSLATANLGGAVEAFFANGGTRAWVVRVAGPAATNEIGIPGLLAGPADDPDEWVLASVRSRSAGSWSDTHRAGAIRRRLVLDGDGTASALGDGATVLDIARTAPVEVGDLLEITFASADRLLVQIEAVETGDDGHPRLRIGQHRWLRQPEPARVTPDAVNVLSTAGRTPVEAAAVQIEALGRVSIHLEHGGAESFADVLPVSPGDTVVITNGSERILTVIHHLGVIDGRLVAEGFPSWSLPAPPADVSSVGRVTGVSSIRVGIGHWIDDRLVGEVGDLACGPGNERRWWGHLPSDEELFSRQALAARNAISQRERERQGPIDGLVAAPRFGLAAGSDAAAILPIGLIDDHELVRTGTPDDQQQDPLIRDGLEHLDANDFLDAGLRSSDARSLRAKIDQRMIESEPEFTGLHALAPVAEVSLLSVPDAVTRPWSLVTIEPPTLIPSPTLDLVPPSGWAWDAVVGADRYRVQVATDQTFTSGVATIETEERRHQIDANLCGRVFARVRAVVGDRLGPWSATLGLRLPPTAIEPCDDPIPAPPTLTTDEPDATVQWRGRPGDSFRVQRSDNPDFIAALDATVEVSPDAATDGDGTALVTVPIDEATSSSARWFRARLDGEPSSPWSNTIGVVGIRSQHWAMATTDEVAPIALDIHRAALALAAARGDLLAILSLPRTIELDQAAAHIDRLAERGEWGNRARSHGAIYHPWLAVARETERGRALTARPADGAVAGVLARRSIDRGAWVAPANERLRGGVGTDEALPVDELARWRALVNPLVTDNGGVGLDQADTLHITGRPGDSAHPGTDHRHPGQGPAPLRAISVRRLMILLHKLAKREGTRHLFEPNGDDLRRMLRTDLETMLGDLFRRGAFAGTTTEQAFRVLVDDADDASTDRAMVVVELQVAPSTPLEFLTVRLVQDGARSRVEEAS